jgi:hypothetical protein
MHENHYFSPISLVIIVVIIIAGCRSNNDNISSLFSKLSPAQSGINFRNDITDTDSTHSFINEFGYMGGGVGIGDFNNDGRKDIFFSGNQVSCRAYINKGNNSFEDITEKASLTTNVWATGVSVVDINNDGYDDIYLSVFGKTLQQRSKNLLFINQHDLTFKEESVSYGLADTGYSTQAVFFDYDKDGDLDMYQVNYLLNGPNANYIIPRNRTGNSPANDRLYRNDGNIRGVGHPVFTDVTLEAGIMEDGFGLGVSVSDFNSDGWPDIYVANDFISNDELWLNNHNGTFTNRIAESLQHQSYSSMGCDAADINNDGRQDIVTLDMLPEYNERRKTSFSFMNYERYQSERSMGYEPEFARNMLQLNNGNILRGDTALPFFSEIGQLAGIQATDWSWSVLLADFDNDGWKDLHITNGIGRDFINADFLEYSNDIFNNNQSREEQQKAIRKKLASFDHVNLANYLYLNNRDYTFTNASEQAGITELSMSNGAAYADLDNDGDLDLVINNISKEAFVFINNTIQKNKPSANHYLSVQLKGDSLNSRGFGAKVILYNEGRMQVQDEFPVRGYFSSVDQQLLFGLGKYDHVDSLVVIWPDDKKQVIEKIIVDTTLVLSWKNADNKYYPQPHNALPLFSDITSATGALFRHHDNPYNDFAIQRLLPQKYSQLGPFIATGDINNDGATDFFVGGGTNFSGQIFTQKPDHSFSFKNLTDGKKMEEDMDCLLFDADGDGDQDLLVSGGDTQYSENSPFYKPRLYFNDGAGNFHLQTKAIPAAVLTITGSVIAGDYDGDGDLDLFIGGRVSKNYPLSPKSFLLQNNKGVFIDVTKEACPALQQAGMITAAVWADFDTDKQPDLIVAGEWMPIRFFKNNKGRFTEVTNSTGLTAINGMWRSLIASDIDKDGDLDLVAGNLGLNCDYRVSPTEPMQVFSKDLDGNGSIDPVFFYYIKSNNVIKESFPGINRNQFADQVPAIKKQFIRHKDYANATFNSIFKGKKENLSELYCDETRTCYLENTGNGKFVKHALPVEAQFAPVNAIICDDIDNDGFNDLVLAGNEYQTTVITGRYDASYGCFLRGSSQKTFSAVKPLQSGFILKGDVKDMALVQVSKDEKLILAALNNDSLHVFRINKKFNIPEP